MILNNKYVIQLGADFANYEGQQFFSLEEAQNLVIQIQGGITDVLKTGDAQEVEEAWKMVMNLRILPFQRH